MQYESLKLFITCIDQIKQLFTIAVIFTHTITFYDASITFLLKLDNKVSFMRISGNILGCTISVLDNANRMISEFITDKPMSQD